MPIDASSIVSAGVRLLGLEDRMHPPLGNRRLLVLAAAAAIAVAALWGCGQDRRSPTSPDVSQSVGAIVLRADHPAVQAAIRVQDRQTPGLLRVAGVVGTATGLDEAGRVVIKVYTESRLAPGRIPVSLDGVPV